jgi:hypothetical protein
MKSIPRKKIRRNFFHSISLSKISSVSEEDVSVPDLGDIQEAPSTEDSSEDIEVALKGGTVISFGHDKDSYIIQGIERVSDALKDYGYLSSTSKEFDQNLSDAIISFQKNNHLNATGQIDYELYQKLIYDKDIIVERSQEEKKLDRSMSGDNFSVGQISKDEAELRKSIFQENADNKAVSESEPTPSSSGTSGESFDLSEVSAGSGIAKEMIEAFIKGESGGNPKAKAFNGDNFCNNLGWSSSSKVEEFLKGLEAGNIKGKSDIKGEWVPTVRFAEKFNGTRKEFKDEYKPKGYKLKSGYIYYDTAYFSAHRDPDSMKAFDLAYSIDPASAVMATAWGKGQVMGKHLIKTNPEILNFSSGQEARDHFDSFAEKASANMFVSWVQRAGRFPRKSSSYISKAEQFGVEDALGKTFAEVAALASANPDKYGYFLFMTKRYYGAWDSDYAKRLQKNYRKLLLMA